MLHVFEGNLSLWSLVALVTVFVPVQALLVCIAVNPRTWRRIYQRRFRPAELRLVTRSKIQDERWSHVARRAALTILLFEVAVALCEVGWRAHSNLASEHAEAHEARGDVASLKRMREPGEPIR